MQEYSIYFMCDLELFSKIHPVTYCFDYKHVLENIDSQGVIARFAFVTPSFDLIWFILSYTQVSQHYRSSLAEYSHTYVQLSYNRQVQGYTYITVLQIHIYMKITYKSTYVCLINVPTYAIKLLNLEA